MDDKPTQKEQDFEMYEGLQYAVMECIAVDDGLHNLNFRLRQLIPDSYYYNVDEFALSKGRYNEIWEKISEMRSWINDLWNELDDKKDVYYNNLTKE